MRAVRLNSASGVAGLELQEVPRPHPGPGEALVEVRAAAITRDELDWPVDRLPATPSYEFSGVVTEVGEAATQVTIGEEVYALSPFDRDGAAADFISAPAGVLAGKPSSLDHENSAALPLAALTAWQGLFDHGHLVQDQRVVVTGPTGGVGHLALQLARANGAHVIAATRDANAERATDLGAHEILSPPTLDDDAAFEPADLVFDTAGRDTLKAMPAVLGTGGRLISIAEDPPEIPPDSGIFAHYFVVEPNREELNKIAERVDRGDLKPVIDSVFPFDEALSAFARSMDRDTRGKVVLTLHND
jgi:NADPH:quinone reductase-like Zn-dependent oxidoreductase